MEAITVQVCLIIQEEELTYTLCTSLSFSTSLSHPHTNYRNTLMDITKSENTCTYTGLHTYNTHTQTHTLTLSRAARINLESSFLHILDVQGLSGEHVKYKYSHTPRELYPFKINTH
jgi:hypothetical protein